MSNMRKSVSMGFPNTDLRSRLKIQGAGNFFSTKLEVFGYVPD